MTSRGSFLIASALLLATVPSFAGDRWCGDKTYPCAVSSYGWTLFVDSNVGTPDFWWGPPVPVREIFVCEHGVQFLFVTRQHERLHHTALVFPTPTRALLAHRLNIQDEVLLESEFEHFRHRFQALTDSLESMSGSTLQAGTRLSFGESRGPAFPLLVVGRKLELHWRDAELKLRGYLDVYFAPLDPVIARRRAPPVRELVLGLGRGEPTDPSVALP